MPPVAMPLTCHACCKSFDGMAALRKHNAERHLALRSYHCPCCKARFHTNALLRHHMLAKHPGNMSFLPGLSGDVPPVLLGAKQPPPKQVAGFRRRVGRPRKRLPLAAAEKAHHCISCDVTMVGFWARVEHNRELHKKRFSHSCPRPDCEQRFDQNKQLADHIAADHSAQDPSSGSAARPEEIGDTVQDATPPLSKPTPSCYRRPAMKRFYKTPANNFFVACSKPVGSPSVNNLQEHRGAGAKPFVCLVCPSRPTFSSHKELRAHRLRGHKKGPSDQCGTPSVKKRWCFQCHVGVGHLMEHLYSVHPRGRLQCTRCGKRFNLHRKLKQHWLQEHGNDVGEAEAPRRVPPATKPRLALPVGKLPARKVGRQPKSKPSDENRPIAKLRSVTDRYCYACQEKFLTPALYSAHKLRAHYKIEGQARFQCPHCSMAFLRDREIQKHCQEEHGMQPPGRDRSAVRIGSSSDKSGESQGKAPVRKVGRPPKTKAIPPDLNQPIAKLFSVPVKHCYSCEEKFLSPSSYLAHKLRVHYKVKGHGRFQCPRCPMTFLRDREIQKHCQEQHDMQPGSFPLSQRMPRKIGRPPKSKAKPSQENQPISRVMSVLEGGGNASQPAELGDTRSPGSPLDIAVSVVPTVVPAVDIAESHRCGSSKNPVNVF